MSDKVLCPVCGGMAQVAVARTAFDFCWFCDGTGLVNKDATPAKAEVIEEAKIEVKAEPVDEAPVEEVKPKAKKKKKEEDTGE